MLYGYQGTYNTTCSVFYIIFLWKYNKVAKKTIFIVKCKDKYNDSQQLKYTFACCKSVLLYNGLFTILKKRSSGYNSGLIKI